VKCGYVEEQCTAPPVLFFTLADGKNPRSEEVLAALRELFRAQGKNHSTLECLAFPTMEAIEKYRQEKKIAPPSAVALFDDARVNGKCFSPFCRGGKKSARMPVWSPAHWGVAINTDLDARRINSVAFQIRADFYNNFLAQLARGKRPWGNLPSMAGSSLLRREKRERHEHQKRYGGF
jgi:hypothetical protein